MSALGKRNELFSTICTIQQYCKQDNGIALLPYCGIHRIVTTLEKLLVTIAFVWSRIDPTQPDAT
jgi:hypothetical protein